MKELNKKVKLFEIDGINMLGNFENGAIIGLDSFGKKYICDRGNNDTCKSELNVEIEQALHDMGFLSTNGDSINLETAYVHVTDHCNLCCLGCYSHIYDRNNNFDLSTEQLISILEKLYESGISKIIISGGEPMLRGDLKDILKYAKEKCRFDMITVISNGYFDKELYLPIIPYINELNISIDGYNENTSFIRDKGIMPKVIDTIKELKPLVPIKLIITLHKKNMQYMSEYSELATSLDVKHSYSIFTVSPFNSLFKEFLFTRQELSLIADNMLKNNDSLALRDINQIGLTCCNSCGAATRTISIAANGDVYPCHMLHNPNMRLGNLLINKELSLQKILMSESNPFLNLDVSCISKCNKCNYKYLCGGGCRARSYYYHNDTISYDSYCDFFQAYYSTIVDEIKNKLNVTLDT